MFDESKIVPYFNRHKKEFGAKLKQHETNKNDDLDLKFLFTGSTVCG